MGTGALTVLYEDNHLLAVAKPAGVLVQGDASGDPTLLEAAKAYLKERYAKPGNVYLGLVHRLDRPVSGLVLFARTSKAAARLSAQFREGRARKTYLAVVEGVPEPAAGELACWLAAAGDAQGKTAAAASPFPGAREARLRYQVRERGGGAALLEVEPATGRRHQIRVQLATAGHPVLGDMKYGARGPRVGEGIALHAWRLTVAHPVGGAEVALEAPPPADWPWPPPGRK